jgi:hypothetical protein
MRKKTTRNPRAKTVTCPNIQHSSCRARLTSVCLLSLLGFVILNPQSLPAASAKQKLKPKDAYALIFGTVWGPDDHPIYGVPVKIRRAKDKHAKWELVSDHAGEFAQRVPAGKGDYVVWTDSKHLKTEGGTVLRLAQPVDVHIEYDERVDIGLHLSR